MQRFVKIFVYALIALAWMGAVSFYISEDFYHPLVAEDGPFENLTAAALLAISVFSFLRLLKQRKERNAYWLILNVLIVVGAFVGFGEEISWGQRIFNIQTGEFFAQNNLQQETNLHNLMIGGVKINKVISTAMVLVFGAYFMISNFLYRKWSWFQRQVDLLGVPLPKLMHTIVMLASTALVMMVPDLRIWELWEAIFVLLLLLVFVEPNNSGEGLFEKYN